METKFYKYANQVLSAKYVNVFADAEEKKDLYKFSNADVINLIKEGFLEIYCTWRIRRDWFIRKERPA